MQGLIIAFIIIGFIYKAYKNFQKESEEAMQRAKDAEQLQKASEKAKALENQSRNKYNKPVGQPFYESIYDKEAIKENQSEPVFESNRQDYYREQAIKKEVRDSKSNKKVPVLDGYNPEIPAEEVVQNRRIHQAHKHSVNFPHHKQKHVAANFNLRQAFIYDVILRRPEY
jgi:hypothetical protein